MYKILIMSGHMLIVEFSEETFARLALKQARALENTVAIALGWVE